MAEGLLRHEADGAYEVFSAGTTPSSLRQEAIAVMSEVGIDISDHWSKPVHYFIGQKFDYVITVCDHAKELCPVLPGETKHIHWSIDDPTTAPGSDEERKLVFRNVRDELHERIKSFLSETTIALSHVMKA